MNGDFGVDNGSSSENDFKAPLPLDAQLTLARSLQTEEGVKEFTDALVGGQLTSLLPLHLDGAYIPDYEGPHIRKGDYPKIIYGVNEIKGNITKGITVRSELEDWKKGYFAIQGSNHGPLGKLGTNKGLSMELGYRFVDGATGARMMPGESILYVQTSGDKLAFDAVIVIKGDGTVKDILPPGDYHAEKLNGDIMREAIMKGKENLSVLHAADQLEASLAETDTRLSHQRLEGQYDALQQQVCEAVGLSKDQLFSRRIDTIATFQSLMNNPLVEQDTLDGKGKRSVPPIIFDAEK